MYTQGVWKQLTIVVVAIVSRTELAVTRKMRQRPCGLVFGRGKGAPHPASQYSGDPFSPLVLSALRGL